jgi:hypothetical protein
MTAGDYDSLKLKVPWSSAALNSIPSAIVFGLMPLGGALRSGDYLRCVLLGAATWLAATAALHLMTATAIGSDGLTIGSVRLAWRDIHEPTMDGGRLRVADSAGMHFHLNEAEWRNAHWIRMVQTHAPTEHPLIGFLRLNVGA